MVSESTRDALTAFAKGKPLGDAIGSLLEGCPEKITQKKAEKFQALKQQIESGEKGKEPAQPKPKFKVSSLTHEANLVALERMAGH